MAVMTCSIGGYKSLPANSRVTAVHLGAATTQVASTMEVLRFVCETYARNGLLTSRKVRSFGFSWLNSFPIAMKCPRLMCSGVYLAEDGQGSTNLLRVTLLLKRLLIPLEFCTIDFEVLEGSQELVDSEAPDAATYLSPWEEGDEEPLNSVQRRLHEISTGEMSALVPFKAGIGGRRFAVSSWGDFANTLLAYIYLNFGSRGPERLWHLQNSPSWEYFNIVKQEGDTFRFCAVPDDLSASYVCRLVNDLISGIGFDRYSVYVKCSVGKPNSSVGKDEAPSHNHDVDESPSGGELASKDVDEHPGSRLDYAEVVTKVPMEEVPHGRHLHPIFRLIED